MSFDQSALPPKVRERLLRYDSFGEVLARLMQVGIVVVMGALYLSAPRTDAGTPFQLVPYILAAYLAFTTFGLVWALRARLPDWAVYISIIIDVGLLTALIWSFHVQYGQPAAFYLKTPTVFYFFVLIAIRALRFEPRFVLMAGPAAMLGWAGLVGYVLIDDGMGAITRDYRLYLTANRVLIGAEVDKLLVIGIVTLVLWLALRRARMLLLQATADAAAVENLSRFFDEPVAGKIAAAEEVRPAESELRDAVTLVTDLRGFGERSATLGPRGTLDLLSAYQGVDEVRLAIAMRAAENIVDAIEGRPPRDRIA
jgi:adenylate cyclase